MGRSQGASIFWGLVSVCFAAAFCFFFWKNHENESSANVLRDEVLALQEQRDALSSQKDKLQEGLSDAATQQQTREQFLQEKESKLAAEEARLENMAQQGQNPPNQAATVKKFDDVVRKIAKGSDAEVVLRGGRPVLRLPGTTFFSFGGTGLKTEGRSILSQILKALDGQMESFELRIESFTDGDSEIGDVPAPAGAPAMAPGKPPAPADAHKPAPIVTAATTPAPATATSPSRYANAWELTSARAAAILRFLQDAGNVPMANILVVGRGDTGAGGAGKEAHARNRRIEITITPLPAAFHPSPSAQVSAGDTNGTLDKTVPGAPDPARAN